MKKLLGILVLDLFLITPSQADDVRDFQIEGMSIGDSLLDYFSEKEINDSRRNYFSNKKYYAVGIYKNIEIAKSCEDSLMSAFNG